jgi:cytochrome c biogenesis protein CcmG, thiol:disulfide interchange protein DsbE
MVTNRNGRKPRAWVTRVLLVVVLAGLSNASAAPRKSRLLNHPAPLFSRTALTNERIVLAGLRGRVVLLNFWATWCAPCQVEIPRFVAWEEKYKADGLSIVGVSMDDGPDVAQSFLRQTKLNYSVVMGDEKLGLAYGGILGLPVTYLIDRHGVIRARFQGETDLNAMENALRRLLQDD